jgi:Mitotic-spindle organizing gamma-tubulin ring associated
MCQEMSQQSDKNKTDLSQIKNSTELRSNLMNISNILNTGLTQEQLEICIQLCEAGVHPHELTATKKISSLLNLFIVSHSKQDNKLML